MGETVLTGRYDIRGLAERDNTGERWLAADLELRRPVVIWLSQPAVRNVGVPGVVRVVHPNVLRTYSAGCAADGRDYLVREFVEGTDLAALSRTSGPLRTEEVAELAVQLARGLEAIHAAGAVLGRVEPTGQLLTRDGTVKITALDTAVTVDRGAGRHAGNPQYVAPERALGRPASAASDWYGLGCVLHLLLVGRPPFTGDTESVLIAHVSEPPTPVRRLCPDVDPRLTGLVDALLAKDPDRRPASAAEFEARLVAPEQTAVLAAPDAGTHPDALDPDTNEQVIRLAVPPALLRRRMLTRARRLTGAGTVASAVVVVVVAGALSFGASNEQAQDQPAAVAARPSHAVRPSTRPVSPRRPSRDQTTPRSAVTPTTRPVSDSSPKPDPAAPFRSLAAVLRADRRAANNQDLQSAATLLDRAAAAAADGSSTTDLVRAAFGHLADAERAGSWHPGASETSLLATLGYHSPTTFTHRRRAG